MWIKREEYESLATYKETHIAAQDNYRYIIDTLQEMYNTTYEQCNKYKTLYEEYKQKYADEVQKRLELVKLLENTT